MFLVVYVASFNFRRTRLDLPPYCAALSASRENEMMEQLLWRLSNVVGNVVFRVQMDPSWFLPRKVFGAVLLGSPDYGAVKASVDESRCFLALGREPLRFVFLASSTKARTS